LKLRRMDAGLVDGLVGIATALGCRGHREVGSLG
jgi:hypothetical protein